MKNIFIKYKAGFIAVIIIFTLLLAFTLTRFIKGINLVDQVINEKLTTIPQEELNDASWNIPEIQQKKKEVNRIEQQLLLAKSDSLNLGISLADSSLLVQLKGTVLLEAKILKQYPFPFFQSFNFGAYDDMTKITSIVAEQSTIIKRPVKKVKAPKNENEVTNVKHDTIPDPLLVWQIKLENQVEIVITGVGMNKDSLIDLNYGKDMIRYSINDLKKNMIPKAYIPTLYLWLSDKDAKAIYRAIPEKGKVVFLNL